MDEIAAEDDDDIIRIGYLTRLLYLIEMPVMEWVVFGNDSCDFHNYNHAPFQSPETLVRNANFSPFRPIYSIVPIMWDFIGKINGVVENNRLA